MLNNVGKVKAKRSKNSKPYERPKSILRRVTDSVTGLLPQPSWLASWLQPSSHQEDSDDEGAEEQPTPSTSAAGESPETQPEGGDTGSFIFRKPPGSNKEQSNGRTPIHPFTMDVNPDPVSTTSGPALRELSIETNGDDDSHSESTSGCSSLVPHPEHRRDNQIMDVPVVGEPLEIDQSSLQMLGSMLSKSLACDLKASRGRKTLSLHTFSQNSSLVSPVEDLRYNRDAEEGVSISSTLGREDMSSLNHSGAKRGSSQPQSSSYMSKRPRFNITSFGPTAAEARRSLLNNSSVVDSPFYAGRTTYGGASAYRRASLQPSVAPYVRNRVQARPSSISAVPVSTGASVASSSNVVLSSSAQRIMQALEAMSTPVRDAKKIPVSAASKRSASFQDEDPTFSGFGLSRRRPNLGPPTTKLSVGTPALIVPRPFPSTSKPASTEAAPLVSSTPITSQAGGKMRSRITAPVRESAREAARLRLEEEEPDVPDLQPVTMPLGLSSLPSFSLLPPPSTVTAPPPPPVSVERKSSDKQAMQTPATTSFNGVGSSLSATPSRPSFTFSAPIVTVGPSVSAAPVCSKPPSFNFSSPVLVKTDASKERETKASPSFSAASELKSESVLNALRSAGSPETPARRKVEKETPPPVTPATTQTGFGDKFKAPVGSWVCSVCCVSNPKDKSHCVACETPNPTASASTPAPAATAASLPTQGFGDKFKMSASQWECPVCMLRNAEKDDKCKSCEERRPGAKPPTPAAVSSFKFGIPAAKEPAGGLKSGATSEKSVSDGAPKLSFGTISSTTSETAAASSGFKFGAAPEPSTAQESASTGFKFGAAVEATPKTVAPSGFTFGAPIQAKKDEKVEGFKFGAMEPSKKVEESRGTSVELEDKSKGTGGFKFGAPVETIKKVEVQAEKPSFDFTKKTDSSATFGSSMFAAPASSGFGAGPTTTAATTTTSSNPTPIFSFGAASGPPQEGKIESGIKPSTTLATGSVMDILGKKTESAPAAPTVSSGISTTSPPSSTSFGTLDQSKPTFSFTKPNVATSTAAPTFSFGGTAPSQPSEDERATKIAPFQSSATSSSFSFGAATSTPSASLFKPGTSAPSFSFGGTAPSLFGATTSAPASSSAPNTFGVPSTAASTTSSATTASGAGSIFSFGAPPNAPASTASSSAAPATGAFSFGLPTTTTAPAAPTAAPSFSFGSTAPPPYSFAVGAPAATPTTSAPTAGPMFGFGAPAVASSTIAATPAEAPKSLFSFGNASQPAAASPAAPAFGSFGTTGAKPTEPFTFGAPASTPSGPSAAPAFGDLTPKSTQSSFGIPSATSFGSMSSAGFGAAPLAPSASPFTFGAQSTPGSTQPPPFNASATPSFSFGSAAPPAAPATGSVFQFGNAAPAANQGFGFNANSSFTTPDAPPSGFASNLFGANPFDITGGSGAAGSNRKIRKAVRRR